MDVTTQVPKTTIRGRNYAGTTQDWEATVTYPPGQPVRNKAKPCCEQELSLSSTPQSRISFNR